MDYKSMTIEELVEEVNKQIAQGASLTSLERDNGLRNKYLSDKLKLRYRLDKDTKQYVLKSDVPTEAPRPQVKQKVVQQVVQVQQFEDDEVALLKQMLEDYRTKLRLQEQDSEAEDKTELANRNIRVYTKQYNRFADWCKDNQVTQAEALYKAIQKLMQG